MFWFAVGVFCALPLLVEVIARMLGFRVFFLEDAYFRIIWGTVAQIGAGWSLYAGALRSARALTAGADTTIAAVSSVIYGYAVYASLRGTSVSPWVSFGTAAGLLVLALLWRLARAVAGRT